MTDEGAARMQAFIADNPKGKHGCTSTRRRSTASIPTPSAAYLKDYIEQLGLAPE